MELRDTHSTEGDNLSNKDIIPVFRWQGEGNCIIGPFKTQLAATQFSGMLSDLVETKRHFQGSVYEHNKQWFIELDR